MEERRKAERFKKENKVTINDFSEDTFIPVEEWSKLKEFNIKDENLPKKEILYNHTKDISVSGAKIQANILLPVDTIFKLSITLRNVPEKIVATGKVKWNKVIIEGESYEAGVEFVDTRDEEIKKIYEMPQEGNTFIPEEGWSKLQEINQKEEVSIAKQIKRTIDTIEMIKTVDDDMKNCRYCSREIKSDAVKCEYCGRTLTQRTAKKIHI
jgi:hypothetical protein